MSSACTGSLHSAVVYVEVAVCVCIFVRILSLLTGCSPVMSFDCAVYSLARLVGGKVHVTINPVTTSFQLRCVYSIGLYPPALHVAVIDALGGVVRLVDKGLGSGRELKRSKAGCIVVDVVTVEDGLGRVRSAREVLASEGSGTVIWSRSCIGVNE